MITIILRISPHPRPRYASRYTCNGQKSKLSFHRAPTLPISNRSCFVRILDRVNKQSQHAGPAIEEEHSLGEAVHWASDLHVMFGSSTGQKQ
ncbi:hypothetical protein CABS03_04398 [Colletotrichum abscissum]|uniref:Uncharacterized protein n=1 Tax=Colletotrichum abscissum TaxID=1671311 RepID=A0A9P9XJY9_9PEZI|nr:hypothetical protein CABS02_04577 [Colletotrichum abscissum]